ncbi:hypothetical protein L218DRAFT_307659 [Marasmius fiardii PR-910]|nr:hypothetical protein L218DRAFT_307659 [Marasmius fiardii PR-910]
MLGFGQQESRKFINLLLQVTNNKWANIDANKEIKVGDFGQIDGATGEFQVEGNLYQDPTTSAAMGPHPIRVTPPTDFEKYLSEGVREIRLSAGVKAGIQPFAEVGFEGKFEFKKKRGALLVLIAPRILSMQGFPTTTVLAEKFQSLLKGRVICTDVVSCPSFCLYLGNNKDHVFSLSLEPTVPVPVAPGVEIGGSVKTDWKFQNAQGLVKKGSNDKGECVYFPLYTLKRVSWGKVASVIRGEEGKDELLLDAEIPWGELDDDGQEVDIPVDSGEPI